MRKAITMAAVFAALLCLSVPAFSKEHHPDGMMIEDGQGRQGGGMHHPGREAVFGDPERLQKALGLSEEQMDKIAELNDNAKKEHRSVLDKIAPKARELKKVLRAETVDLEKARAILKEIGDLQVDNRMIMIRHRLDIEKVLAADQRKKLRDMRPEMTGPMMKGPMRGDAPSGPMGGPETDGPGE